MKRSELDIVLKELTEQIYNLLGDKLEKVVLYGSYARGDNTEESDVDVLVLTNMAPEENRKILWTLNKIFSRVGLEHDILLSMFLLDKNSFHARKPILPFYQNIEKDGVVVYAA
ncbi:MAG: nucleotidyltransferase domain-containing protein [Phascolarctobacterium sp.]